MTHKTLLTLLLTCSPMFASAHNLTVGQTVPNIAITNHGEIVLNGDDTTYQAWNSGQLLGKVRVIQAIAGRSSSKALNASLMTAITAAKFPSENYQTTTIINQDDSIWGTGSFVKSSAQDSKRDFPWSSMVLDEDGRVAEAWALAEENSAIIVQDKQGQILFVQEGALDDAQIQQVITLIQANL